MKIVTGDIYALYIAQKARKLQLCQILGGTGKCKFEASNTTRFVTCDLMACTTYEERSHKRLQLFPSGAWNERAETMVPKPLSLIC